MLKLVNGMTVRDVVTGFEGVVTSVVQHLVGCDQVAVTPPATKDGDLREPKWLEAERLEVLNGGVVVELPCSVVDDVQIGFTHQVPA